MFQIQKARVTRRHEAGTSQCGSGLRQSVAQIGRTPGKGSRQPAMQAQFLAPCWSVPGAWFPSLSSHLL